MWGQDTGTKGASITSLRMEGLANKGEGRPREDTWPVAGGLSSNEAHEGLSRAGVRRAAWCLQFSTSLSCPLVSTLARAFTYIFPLYIPCVLTFNNG